MATVETYAHPYDALPKIDADIDLLIVDVEMPGMDGKKFVDYARQKGLPARRIVVTSAHSADELHERFRLGEAIAVINKTDPKQQEAFLMILDSVMRR
jgi:CheY-like chemotaxis protein